MKILLALNGSAHSLDAVKCLIDRADGYREKPQVVGAAVARRRWSAVTKVRAGRRSPRRRSCSSAGIPYE
jgi:hypothetical protein